ncbi:hypothetical protein B5S28_g2748 [[Candida] boidinii]|nr:hypothetical protein B5S28_g2748 [[Candida] boidinii]
MGSKKHRLKGLQLNIEIAEAKDLISNEDNENERVKLNPKVACTILPKSTTSSKKVKNSINPQFNETVKLKLLTPKLNKYLKYNDNSILYIKVYDISTFKRFRLIRRKNYLGELRLSLIDILTSIKDSDMRETSFKWYNLYSNKTEKRFTIGSIKLKFSVSLTSSTSGNHGKQNIKKNEENDLEDSEFLSDASSYISSNIESEEDYSQSEIADSNPDFPIENSPNKLLIPSSKPSSRPPSLYSVESTNSTDLGSPDFLILKKSIR